MKGVSGTRKLTDAQVKVLREWKSLKQLAREWGVNRDTVSNARRRGYVYKHKADA